MAEVRDMWVTPFGPNGLQAAADGLWVMAESDAALAPGSKTQWLPSTTHTDNHIYKLRYEDGAVITKVPTEAEHAGGVTEGGGYLWATTGYDLIKIDYDGSTVERFLAPGGQGAHGVEWVDDGSMWVIDPGAHKAHLVDPATMEIKRSITTPGRMHGLFYHDGALWCGEYDEERGCGRIYKLDAHTGEVLHQIDVAEPEVHGMTRHGDSIWFCCAKSHRVCTVPLPA